METLKIGKLFWNFVYNCDYFFMFVKGLKVDSAKFELQRDY